MRKSKFKILLAEDDQIFATYIKKILERSEHIVEIAKSGEELINKWNNSIDLLIADISMPGKYDGIDAANIITKKKNIPVIIMSARNIEDYMHKIEFKKCYYLDKSLCSLKFLQNLPIYLQNSPIKINCIN